MFIFGSGRLVVARHPAGRWKTGRIILPARSRDNPVFETSLPIPGRHVSVTIASFGQTLHHLNEKKPTQEQSVG